MEESPRFPEGTWWRYSPLGVDGKASEFHGPYAAAMMLAWEHQGYFSAGNAVFEKWHGEIPSSTPGISETVDQAV